MESICCDIDTLPKPPKILLDGIPDGVPNYMKEYKSKEGFIDLDDPLYRHAKEMVCNHTEYLLWINDPTVRENKKGHSTSNDKTIGVMVIEKDILAKGMVSYIIHYMCNLSKFRHKEYGKYVMGNSS